MLWWPFNFVYNHDPNDIILHKLTIDIFRTMEESYNMVSCLVLTIHYSVYLFTYTWYAFCKFETLQVHSCRHSSEFLLHWFYNDKRLWVFETNILVINFLYVTSVRETNRCSRCIECIWPSFGNKGMACLISASSFFSLSSVFAAQHVICLQCDSVEGEANKHYRIFTVNLHLKID